ncbi:MAG: 50S ribosomal protein L18Ae [Methanopyri archaeon]|nr:50S ribosomal protein L18Ae [Methanopyri archaeon]
MKGSFRMGRNVMPFTKTVTAENKDDAKELIYSLLGSKHKAKRTAINIDAIAKVDAQ